MHWLDTHISTFGSYSVKENICENIDPCQPAQFRHAEMGQNCLQSLNFLHVKEQCFIMVLLVKKLDF